MDRFRLIHSMARQPGETGAHRKEGAPCKKLNRATVQCERADVGRRRCQAPSFL